MVRSHRIEIFQVVWKLDFCTGDNLSTAVQALETPMFTFVAIEKEMPLRATKNAYVLNGHRTYEKKNVLTENHTRSNIKRLQLDFLLLMPKIIKSTRYENEYLNMKNLNNTSFFPPSRD